MSAKIHYESDASLSLLDGKTIVFIEYGNQGRAQCLNLRDTIAQGCESFKSLPHILATSLKDRYAATAAKDGVESTTDFAGAAAKADILFLLVPDQVQPELFNTHLAPVIKPGACIVVASGYNYFYNKLSISPECDVVMASPRMIGTSVRSLFEKGQGFPCFISSEQDASGKAHEICLALSLGIGALKTASSVPTIIVAFQEAYSTLKALGASHEALCYELFMSKEAAEIFEKMADDGFVKQLVHQSTVPSMGS
ncbi:hypothetical protein ABEF95_014681 [Exophiala dermatitidis]